MATARLFSVSENLVGRCSARLGGCSFRSLQSLAATRSSGITVSNAYCRSGNGLYYSSLSKRLRVITPQWTAQEPLPTHASVFSRKASVKTAVLKKKLLVAQAATVVAEHPKGERFDVDLFRHRLGAVSKFSGVTDLSATGEWWYGDEARTQSSSCGSGEDAERSSVASRIESENVMGLSRIPVGVVSPLLVRGQHVNGYVSMPWATTEGALIASGARGALALTRAGGARCFILSDVVRSSPTLVLSSLDESLKVRKWIGENKQRIMENKMSAVSDGVEMTGLEADVAGQTVHVAMTFNLDSAGTESAAVRAGQTKFLEMIRMVGDELPEVSVEDFYLDTFRASTRHTSHTTILQPQGITVQVECFLTESIIKDVLKTTSSMIVDMHKYMQDGHMMSGSALLQINTANALCSMFLSTGQDLGRINECALNKLTIEAVSPAEISRYQQQLRDKTGDLMPSYNADQVDFQFQCGAGQPGQHTAATPAAAATDSESEGGLYVAMMMPSLSVRTTEGANLLPTQQECLQMMHCTGPDGRYRLAEIMACAALGLDISTLAAVASGQFASAHEKLGRNRSDLGLRPAQLNEKLFREVTAGLGELIEWKPSTVDARTSILSDMTKTQINKLIGHRAFDMTVRKEDGSLETVPMVMKSKSTDRETCNLLNRLAQGCGLELAVQYEKFKMEIGQRNCHIRELEILSHTDPRYVDITPRTFFVKKNPEKEVLFFFMERLQDMKHFRTADDPSPWTQDDVKLVLADIAGFHAIHYGKEAELLSKEWIDVRRPADMAEKEKLWTAMLGHNGAEHPEIWTKEICDVGKCIISHIGEIWQHFEQSTRTLVHNDFNTRNLCIRPASQSTDGKEHLCCYDWELATIHVPQHDVAEFLVFTQPADKCDLDEWQSYMNHHRISLEEQTGVKIDPEQYQLTFDLAMCDLLINRLSHYGMVHTFKDYRFHKRTVLASVGYLQERKAVSALLSFLR